MPEPTLDSNTQRASISAVIPVYNSEASLGLVVARLEPVLRAVASQFEIILVDDESRDGSWEAIRRLCNGNPCIQGLRLMRNSGQHNALLCGIRAARMELTVTLDDDLQNPPEEIPVLLEKLQEGTDVVYGTPRQERHGLLRDLASQITKFALQEAMGASTARQVSAFRLFRTGLREAFRNYQGPFVSIDVLLTWSTSRFAAVQVRHDPRAIGVSNYTIGKLLRHAMNMITGFSSVPLQAASFIGFFFTFLGTLVLFYVVGRYMIQGTTVAGFPFLASIVAIFSGAQLLVLGIIGEYLARIHFRTMDRPTYTVGQRLSQPFEEARPPQDRRNV
jgi:glycosyltransferase involved in cell wall biosynthesis